MLWAKDLCFCTENCATIRTKNKQLFIEWKKFVVPQIHDDIVDYVVRVHRQIGHVNIISTSRAKHSLKNHLQLRSPSSTLYFGLEKWEKKMHSGVVGCAITLWQPRHMKNPCIWPLASRDEACKQRNKSKWHFIRHSLPGSMCGSGSVEVDLD